MKASTTSGRRPSESGTDPTDQVQSLQSTLRDVVALAALPSNWADSDLPRGIQNLTNVLRDALRALTVCVRIELLGGADFCSTASDGSCNGSGHRWDAQKLFDAIDCDSTELIELVKFNGSGPLSALPCPIVCDGRRIGCLVACYKSQSLPSARDPLLMQVAANQIALLFQRHTDKEERLARQGADNRLRQAEHHYQQLVGSLPAAVYTCDNEGRITLYNEAAARLWGRRPTLGEDLWCGSWKVFKPDGSALPLNECPMAIAIREGRSVRGQEIIVERPDGTRAWVLPHPDPIRDESGKIVGTVNMLVEVDDLKRAEQAARANEARIQSLLTLMPAAVYACDAEGRITFYNRRAVDLWGLEPKLNDSHQRFCAAYKCWFGDQVLRPEETPMAIAVREGKEFRNLEPVFERPDGAKLSVLVNIDPLRDPDGKPAGAINVFQDITPLKLAQDELKNREEHLQAIVENTPDCVKLVAEDGTLLGMNEAGLAMVEADCAEQVLGRNIYSVIAPEYQSAFRAMNERVCAGKRECLEFEIIGLKGTRRWMETHAAPIVDSASGRTVQIAVTRDVTERRKAELELHRKNKQLAAFLETAAVGLHRVGPDGVIQWANDAELEMLGYAREEYVGHHIREFHVDDAVIDDILKRLAGGEKIYGYQARLKCKDGSIKDALIDSTVLWEDGRFLHTQSFTRDITEKKRIEETLRQNERRLRDLVEALPAAVYTTDAQGRITMFNQAAVEFSGRVPQIGSDVWCVSWKLYWPDGRPLPHDQCPMAIALKEGRAVRGYEAVAERPDGTRINFVPYPTPLRGPDGEVTGAINMLVDITARKRAETALRQSEAQLQTELADSKLLQAISTEIVSESSTEALYQKLVEAAAAMMRSDFASMQIYCPERGTGELHLLALRGFRPEARKTWEWVNRASHSSCGEALRRGERVVATDVERCEFLGCEGLAAYRAAGIRSMQSTPLYSRHGELVGMISTHWRQPHEPTESKLRLFDILARLAADLIERRRAEMLLRESEEKFRNIFNQSTAGIAQVDLDGRFLLVNQRFCEITGYSADALSTKTCAELTYDDDRACDRSMFENAVRERKPYFIQKRYVRSDGSLVWVRNNVSLMTEADDSVRRLLAVSIDITEQRRSEQALALKVRQQRAVAELGLFALRQDNLQALFDRAAAEISRTLEVEYCKVLELLPTGDAVLLRAGVGWKEGLVGSAMVSIGRESQAGYTLLSSEPVVVKDLRNETRFDGPPLLHEHGVVSGLSCVIFGENGPWGVLGAHTKSFHEFTEDDAAFLQSVANVLATSIRRRRAEEGLRQSNALLQCQKDSFQAAMRGSSLSESLQVLIRKAIEFTGGNARAAFYITSPDGLTLNHIVGMPEHYAKAVDGFPVNGESMACGLAVHTGRPVITRDVEEDSSWDAFRWLARQHNFRACWSFPVHTVESPALGTLAMYFPEPRQPTPGEMELVNVIAHAATVIISRHQHWSERERAEQQLRETNERLKKVLEVETVGVMFWDMNTGCLVDANDTFLDMMGYTRAEVQSRSLTWEKFTPPEYHEISRAEIAKMSANGRVGPYEKEYFHKDGTRRWLLFAGSSLGNDQCVEFCVDISERKMAEQALRQSEERYRATFESAAIGIAHVGLDGRWLRFNDAVCAIIGYAREELERMTFTDITHPDDLSRDWQEARRLLAGEISRYSMEKRYIRKDGALVWTVLTVSLMRDAAHQPLHFVSVIENIDEKKRAREILEQTVAERTAQLRDTVAELEAFSYSVAHDMRAPLRAMSTYSRFLQEDFAESLPQRAKDFTRRIAAGAQRLDALITDVLNYSKVTRGELNLEPVDVERLTREIVDSYPNLQESGAAILVQSPVPPVVANTAALTQCISNLLSNAVKFVAPGETPRVVIRSEKKGEFVRLWFEDNGIGMSEGKIRIFHMFQRLNPASDFDGTGVGLTIVRKAVERMGGRVGVESQLGAGSRFWIELKHAP